MKGLHPDTTGQRLRRLYGLTGSDEKTLERQARAGPGHSKRSSSGPHAPRASNTISVRWVPVHGRVAGNELADIYARAATESGFSDSSDHRIATRTSLSVLCRSATEQATLRWQSDIEGRNADRRVFRLRTPKSRPGIRPKLRRAPKQVAARYSKLLSCHAGMALFQGTVGMDGQRHM